MTAIEKYEVTPDKLRWECDLSSFDFDCTSDLAPLAEFIGQERAIRAIEFGLTMNRPGYNIFVAGLTGTGKTSVVKDYIERLMRQRELAAEIAHPHDWCYLYNFADFDRPLIVSLPQGHSRVFRDQVALLLDRLREELSRAFSSEEYEAQRKRIIEEGQTEQRSLFEQLDEAVRREGFLFQMTPAGPMLVPLVEGKTITQEQYYALADDQRRAIDDKRAELQHQLQDSFEQAQHMGAQVAARLAITDRAVGEFTVSRLFAGLIEEYAAFERIVAYLDGLKQHTLDNLDLFKGQPTTETTPVQPRLAIPQTALERDPYGPFRVNVFVDSTDVEGPPVVIEANPNFGNLFGKIERRFYFGGYISDHTMLKAGALARANGGYLLLNAPDVLSNAAVWPALKRAIKNKEATVEDPFEQFGLIVPQAMRPQPMPLDVKVVLFGDAMVYYLLSTYDEDFWELFRVKADFDFEVERTPSTTRAYAEFIAGVCQQDNMRHFDRSGVARVVEFAARFVAQQDKLSTRFAQIKELIEEAEYWAARDGATLVSGPHVERAVEERRFRHSLVDERIRDSIRRDTIMIDTEGAVVGQVNGLSVYNLGDIAFGRPSRITAKTFLGQAGVINIERESRLGGPIHNKGVLILSGYLGWKYAQQHPLSLSASLCFEQSYEGVDGDSASSTELYAIISGLADLPLRQDIAVTGSVNQKGEIQPIGGVNQKIEGFFAVCQAKGLTGAQGALIPSRNVNNLMLRNDVVEAVRDGQFHVYAVGTADEGIEVLTGVAAGERQPDGSYPEGTVNYRVAQSLHQMAERMRSFRANRERRPTDAPSEASTNDTGAQPRATHSPRDTNRHRRRIDRRIGPAD